MLRIGPIVLTQE